MSTKLSSAKEAVRTQTQKTLSKYSVEQLSKKLEAGTLLGMSKEIAIEIIEKRKGKSVTTSITSAPKEKEVKKASAKAEQKTAKSDFNINDTVEFKSKQDIKSGRIVKIYEENDKIYHKIICDKKYYYKQAKGLTGK